MEHKIKTCRDTIAIQTHRILPPHTNFYGNLLDNTNFLRPLPEGNSVYIESYVTGAGKTSVEVFAKIIGEDLLSGERYIAATSFLTILTRSLHLQTTFSC